MVAVAVSLGGAAVPYPAVGPFWSQVRIEVARQSKVAPSCHRGHCSVQLVPQLANGRCGVMASWRVAAEEYHWCHLASRMRPGALTVALTGPLGCRTAMSTPSCVSTASVVTTVQFLHVKVPALFHLVPCKAMASTPLVPAVLRIWRSRPLPRLLTLKFYSRKGAALGPRGRSLRDAPRAEARAAAGSKVSRGAAGTGVPVVGHTPPRCRVHRGTLGSTACRRWG